jgi:hypothetical protein
MFILTTGETKMATKTKKATRKTTAKVTKVTVAKATDDKAATTAKSADDQTIRLLVSENPKRGKSRDRFALYQNGQTVEAYIARSIKAGNTSSIARADLRWDLGKGLIAVQ